MRWSEAPTRSDLGLSAWLFSLFLLALPGAVLGWLASRYQSMPLAVGAGVQALFVLVFLRVHPVWRPPVSTSVVVLYLVALAWAWIPTRGAADWGAHLAHGVLLLGGVGLLAVHDLSRIGAEPLRRANKWCRRIAGRSRWPAQLAECRTLPEAAALRGAIRDEPGPALALLSDPRPEVQVAALGALEYRGRWRPGEAELVLRTAAQSPEPVVRAAAAYALAGVETAELVEGLAGLLRDPAVEVRRAAAEALLWEGDRRWPLAREAVREALADPRLAADGPLLPGTGRLPAAAVCDLTVGAADAPPLSTRSIRTLIEQYHADLLDGGRPELASELAAQMLAPDTPPGLRVEIAALLRDHQLLTPDLLDRLTNLDQPGPMRLFAAEVLLRANPNDPDGLDVLRGLARQPNREMAVAIAGILQNVLGLNLGLPPGDLPAPTSKQAAEIARRVQAWANGAAPHDMLRVQTPGPMPGLKPPSRPPFPGLQKTNIYPPPDQEPRPRGANGIF
jgi:hypothetical protein